MAVEFIRHQRNPLITARNVPYQANAVFNAGVADLGKEVVMLVRVESSSGRSHLIVARSKDGIDNWRFEEEALLHPAQRVPYEENGVEDCRLTWMEDLKKWAIAYVAYSDFGPAVALATTTDFKTAERLGVVFPPTDKNAALFPRKFNGLYAMCHRPSVGGGSIWISYSPDLVFWGKNEMVIGARGGAWWDGQRVGIGPTPVELREGWLAIYHGVKDVAGGPVYRMGAALLDKNEPHKVLGRARRWLLSPQEPYERNGDAPNVVFATGAVIRGEEMWLYYGAADCSICMATAKIKDILSVIQEESV